MQDRLGRLGVQPPGGDLVLDDSGRLVRSLGRAVRARLGERVVDVGRRQHASGGRERRRLAPAVVARSRRDAHGGSAAVTASGARAGACARTRSVRYGCRRTRSRSSAVSGPGALPDRVGHADATDVVDERGPAHGRHGVIVETKTPGGGFGEVGHAGRVPEGPRRLEVREVCDGAADRIELLLAYVAPGRRLGGERRLPRLVQVGQQLSRGATEHRGERRVVGRTGPSVHDGDRRLETPGPVEHLGVARERHHARRPADRLTGGAGREALAVPALERLQQAALHSLWESEPLRQPARDFAGGRVHLARAPLPLGEGGRQLGDAARRGDRTHEPRQLLAAARGVDRRERRPSSDLVTERCAHHVRVGRAAEVAQLRRVVDDRQLPGLHARRLGEPRGDHARAQRMLERLSHAKVGRERDRGHHLGQAELLHMRIFAQWRPTESPMSQNIGGHRPTNSARRSALPRSS